MKKIFLAFGIFLIMSVSYAQDQSIITESTSFWYVYMEFNNEYPYIPQNIGTFYQILQQQGFNDFNSPAFGIFFDSFLLEENADTVYGIGLQTNPDIVVSSPLKKAEYKYNKVVRMNYQGSYNVPSDSYLFILPYLRENKYTVIGPPIDIWLNDPNNTPPDSCRTEIYVPVSMK